MQQDAKDAGTGNIIGKPSVPGKRKKEFRMNAKSFFLTYPHCNAEKKDLVEAMSKLHPVTIYVVSCEPHADGTPHLHAFFKFAHKLNIKSEEHFDFDGYHGNYQTAKDCNAVIAYVKKFKNFIENIAFDDGIPDGFVRRKKDFDAYIDYHQFKGAKEIEFPIIFLGNGLPGTGKKRHLLHISDSNHGKTQEMKKVFAGTRVYFTNDGEYPMDTYAGERIVIFDMWWPKFKIIETISDTPWPFKVPVGKTRNRNVYFPIGLEVTIIITCNQPPSYWNETRFTNRFIIDDQRLIKHPPILNGECFVPKRK